MSYKINFRKDTSLNWSSNNPILLEGEPGFETNTGSLKIGDGITPWNDLIYLSTNSQYGVNRIVAGNGISVGPTGGQGSVTISVSAGFGTSGINGTPGIAGTNGTSGSSALSGSSGTSGLTIEPNIKTVRIPLTALEVSQLSAGYTLVPSANGIYKIPLSCTIKTSIGSSYYAGNTLRIYAINNPSIIDTFMTSANILARTGYIASLDKFPGNASNNLSANPIKLYSMDEYYNVFSNPVGGDLSIVVYLTYSEFPI